MKLHRLLALVVFTIGSLMLSNGPAFAGGGGGGGGACAGFSKGSKLIMRDSCFDGVAHFSESGSTLLVENGGIFPHTYTAADGSFDTGILQPGESAEIVLGTDGTVKVWCTLHGTALGDGMAGVLLIGAPATSGAGALSSIAVELDGSSEHTLAGLDSQMEPASRFEGDLAKLYTISQSTTVAVVVVGGLVGALVIGVGRGKNRTGEKLSTGSSEDPVIDSD